MKSSKLNFLFYSVGIAISGILSFIFIPVVVQMCGKEVYGAYSMIFNTLSIVCMFCYTWIGQSFVRFFSQQSQQLGIVSVKLLNKSLALGFTVFVPLVFLITTIDFYELLLFAPTFFIFGYYCFYLWVFQVKQRAFLIMICEVLRTAINIISTIILLHFFDNQNAIKLLSLSLFFSYLFPLLILHSKNEKLNIKLNKQETKTITKQIMEFGIPLAIFSSCSLALSVNDRFLIYYLINKEAAGAYSAIYDVINKGVVAAFSPILVTFYPIIFRLFDEKKGIQALTKIRKLIFIEAILMISGFIVLLLFSPYLLEFIFKKKPGSNLIWVTNFIYIGVCLWQVAMLVHKPLELKLQTKFMAIAIFLALIVNALTNFFIIRVNHNLLVPAITTVVGSGIYIILVVIYIQRKKSLIINV